jgi:hypothetical protein
MRVSSSWTVQRKIFFLLFSSQCIFSLVLEDGWIPGKTLMRANFLQRRTACGWQGMRLRGGATPLNGFTQSDAMPASDDVMHGVDEGELSRMMGFPTTKSESSSSQGVKQDGEVIAETCTIVPCALCIAFLVDLGARQTRVC